MGLDGFELAPSFPVNVQEAYDTVQSESAVASYLPDTQIYTNMALFTLKA
jgi:hypothetical protein